MWQHQLRSLIHAFEERKSRNVTWKCLHSRARGNSDVLDWTAFLIWWPPEYGFRMCAQCKHTHNTFPSHAFITTFHFHAVWIGSWCLAGKRMARSTVCRSNCDYETRTTGNGKRLCNCRGIVATLGASKVVTIWNGNAFAHMSYIRIELVHAVRNNSILSKLYWIKNKKLRYFTTKYNLNIPFSQ